MFAVSTRDWDVAKKLVAGGASVNHIARPHGYTPLMAALGMSNEAFVEWLLDCGADPAYTMSTLHANLAHYGKEYEMLRRVTVARKRRRSSNGSVKAGLKRRSSWDTSLMALSLT
jgi:hypothetical protein